MGSPALGKLQELLFPRQFGAAVGEPKSVSQSEIIGGQNVGSPELKNQKHFNGPAPDPTDVSEPRDNFFVVHACHLPRRRNDTGDCLFREVAESRNLGSRKSSA